MTPQPPSSGVGPFVSEVSEQGSLNSRIRLLVRLGRPRYLLKSAMLYGLGATLALHQQHPFSLGWWLYGLVLTWCLHLGTHYCNEFFDLEADRKNLAPTEVTGGSRILAEGALPAWLSLATSGVFFVLCIALLMALPSGIARALSFIGVGLAWSYTAPPLRLNYRGLGELTVALVFSTLLPALSFYLQANKFDPIFLVIFLPCTVAQFGHSLLMNLLDHDGDRAAGKKTLAVALGRKRSAQLHVALHPVVYLSALALFWAGMPITVLILLWCTLPLSIMQVRRILRGELGQQQGRSTIGRWAAIHTASILAATSLGLFLGTQPELSHPQAAIGYALSLTVPVLCFAFMASNLVKPKGQALTAGTPERNEAAFPAPEAVSGDALVEFDLVRSQMYERALKEYPQARREEMALMFEHLSPRPGESIVGFGEGNGFFCKAIVNAVGAEGFYLVTDPSPYQLERLPPAPHPNLQTQVAGAEALVVAPASFDKAWSCGAFHHCGRQSEALRRIFQALRPGGKLVIIDVFSGTDLSRHFDAVVARYSVTGHEVKFLSDEFAFSACVLAGFKQEDIEVIDTTIHWYFDSRRDMGRFIYSLHSLTLLPEDEERRGYPLVIQGCKEILGVHEVDNQYALRWPIKTLIARKSATTSEESVDALRG